LETQTVTIRTKTGGPLRRAGLALGVVGQWVEHEIECTVDGFKKLLMLAEDPAITVDGKDDDGTWHALPDADTLKAAIASLTPANDGTPPAAEAVANAVNTILPTARPTLEREETQDNPGEAAAEEAQPLAPDPAQNAAGTGGQEDPPAPDAPVDTGTPAPEPDALVDDTAKAEPEA